MLRLSTVALACLLAWGLPTSALAQTGDALAPITITGSAIDDRFSSTATDPVSTVTITRQQVEEQHAKNCQCRLRH